MTPPEQQAGEQDDPYLGTHLMDRYELTEKIGEGGMGNVYFGVQHPLERDVAVKLLKPEQTNEEGEHYFMREVQAINMLRHPNIINIVDFGKEENLLYLVMEFVPGETLRSVIDDEFPLEPKRICNILIQVLSALQQAHQTDIVHCDLKPANIMLEEVAGQQDFVKVLDFGIAKVKSGGAEAGPHTQAGNLVGTFHYMSPEQVMREELDGRADIWAIGVILFEMLTQERIFDEADAVSIIGQVMQMDLPTPSDYKDDVPQVLEDITMKAITREKDQRYQSADEMRKDLKSAVRELENPSSSPESSVSPNIEPDTQTQITPAPSKKPKVADDKKDQKFDESFESELLNENLMGQKTQATVMAVKKRSRSESRIGSEELARRSKKEANLVRRIVESYGGEIDSFLGGMFVVLFDSELPDSQARAIQAALRLQSEFQSLPQGATHIGISLSWGDIHFSQDEEGNAYGDAVDRALMLADASKNASILSDQQLKQRAGHMETQKGRSIQDTVAYPVQAHTGPKIEVDEPEPSEQQIYVPRPEAYDRLSGIFSKAKNKGGRGVIIEGPEGAGKTTFLEQFLDEQQLTDVSVFRAQNPPPGRLSPVRIWMQQIAKTYDNPEELLERAAKSLGIDQKIDELSSLFLTIFSGDEPDETQMGVEPEEFKHLSAGLMDRLLRYALKQGPVVLSCDPIPDNTELKTFLNRLLDQIEDYPVLIVGTKEGTGTRIAQATLEDYERLSLESFNEEQVGIFLKQVLGHPPSPELRSQIHRVSGGNPVFLKELVRNRSLSELELDTGSSQFDSGSIRLLELLQERLQGLSDQQMHLLKLLSCLGENPRKSWVIKAAPDKLDAEKLLDSLIEKGHIVEREVTEGIKTIEFNPPALHNVVYEKLPEQRRQKIHGYVIKFLKEKAHLTDLRAVDVPQSLAYHFQQIDKFKKAAAEHLKAGQIFIAQCDYNRAIDELENAVNMAEIGDVSESSKLKVEINTQLLTALKESGQLERAKTVLDGLPDIGQISASQQPKVLQEIGQIELETGSLQKSKKAFQKLGQMARKKDSRKLEIKSLLGLAEICEKTNDTSKAADLLKNMASKVENVTNLDLGDPEDRKLFWTAYNQLGILLIRQKNYPSARKFLNAALKRARSIDDKRGLVRVLCNLGALCLKIREMEEAKKYFKKALSYAREIGDLLNQTRILTNLGISSMNLNRYEESKKYFSKAKSLAEEIGWYEGLAELSVHIQKLKKNLSPKTG